MVIHLAANTTLDDPLAGAYARILGEQAGWSYPGRDWASLEPLVADEWERMRGRSELRWDDVRDEVHSAWQGAWLERQGAMRDHAPVMDDRRA